MPKKNPKHPIDLLLEQLDEGGLSHLFRREVRFSPTGLTWRQSKQKDGRKRWRFELVSVPRLWRWDLAAPEIKLAIEYQGGTFMAGAHARGAGLVNDYLKLAHAELDGWLVLLVDTKMLRSGVAYDLVLRAVEKRENG